MLLQDSYSEASFSWSLDCPQSPSCLLEGRRGGGWQARPLSTVFSSVQFSCSVVSNSLWPHEPQHARLPCPSPNPRVYPNPCPLSQWCHPTISSAVIPFSSCPQFFPASGSFQMSQLFASGGQSIGVSASTSNEHPGLLFRMDWLNLLVVQGTLKSLLQHHSSKASILRHSAFFIVQLSHPYMTTGKTIGLTRRIFVDKIMSLLFNTLYRCHGFFSKKQESFNFMATGNNCSDFGDQENKVCHCFHRFPTYLPWSDGNGCHDLSFLNVEF